MKYGLLGGEDKKAWDGNIYDTFNMLQSLYFRCHTSEKEKNQVMNNLEVEINNYESWC